MCRYIETEHKNNTQNINFAHPKFEITVQTEEKTILNTTLNIIKTKKN